MSDRDSANIITLGEKIMKKMKKFKADREFTLYEFQDAIKPLHEDPQCSLALKSLEEENFLEVFYENNQPLIRLTLNGHEFSQGLN